MSSEQLSNSPRVLVVDDCEDALLMFRELFERAGAAVTQTVDSSQSIAIALEQQQLGTPFDMIILDVRMPQIDGLEVGKRLRDGGYQGPIVAFTSNASMQGKQKSANVGISAYFSKATLRPELIKALLEHYCAPVR